MAVHTNMAPVIIYTPRSDSPRFAYVQFLFFSLSLSYKDFTQILGYALFITFYQIFDLCPVTVCVFEKTRHQGRPRFPSSLTSSSPRSSKRNHFSAYFAFARAALLRLAAAPRKSADIISGFTPGETRRKTRGPDAKDRSIA